jgi:hypothetical protein
MFGPWNRTASPLNMGPKCPDTSVTNDQPTLRNIPEQRRPQIYPSKSLKYPRILYSGKYNLFNYVIKSHLEVMCYKWYTGSML